MELVPACTELNKRQRLSASTWNPRNVSGTEDRSARPNGTGQALEIFLIGSASVYKLEIKAHHPETSARYGRVLRGKGRIDFLTPVEFLHEAGGFPIVRRNASRSPTVEMDLGGDSQNRASEYGACAGDVCWGRGGMALS